MSRKALVWAPGRGLDVDCPCSGSLLSCTGVVLSTLACMPRWDDNMAQMACCSEKKSCSWGWCQVVSDRPLKMMGATWPATGLGLLSLNVGEPMTAPPKWPSDQIWLMSGLV